MHEGGKRFHIFDFGSSKALLGPVLPTEQSGTRESDAAPISFRAYAETAVRGRLNKMLLHAEGVRSGVDVDAVHDMRVASRRLRAAISVFAAAFPVREYIQFEREVKGITDALGEARDLDVMIESLREEAEKLPVEIQGGILSFVVLREQDRAARQTTVDRALDRLQKRDLPTMFEKMITPAGILVSESLAGEPGGETLPLGEAAADG